MQDWSRETSHGSELGGDVEGVQVNASTRNQNIFSAMPFRVADSDWPVQTKNGTKNGKGLKINAFCPHLVFAKCPDVEESR